MKAFTLLGAAAIMAAACSAQATLVVNNSYSSFVGGGVIPDGNPAGFVDSESVSGVSDLGAVDNVTVSLNISGGYNGDLYGYLVYQPSGGGSSVMSVLLNRPGLGNTGGGPALQYFGYADAGMNVTLNDATHLTSIDNYGGNVLRSGIPTGTFNSAGGTLNSAYNGVSTANGTWTLALFDMSAGGGNAVLNSWALSVDEVPEPVTWALIIFGAVAVSVLFLNRKRRDVMIFSRLPSVPPDPNAIIHDRSKLSDVGMRYDCHTSLADAAAGSRDPAYWSLAEATAFMESLSLASFTTPFFCSLAIGWKEERGAGIAFGLVVGLVLGIGCFSGFQMLKRWIDRHPELKKVNLPPVGLALSWLSCVALLLGISSFTCAGILFTKSVLHHVAL